MTTEQERPEPECPECKGTSGKKLLVLITDEDYEPKEGVNMEREIRLSLDQIEYFFAGHQGYRRRRGNN